MWPFGKKKKKTSNKSKKQKKPFISESEWKEFEDEDDEMVFIDEFIEDDQVVQFQSIVKKLCKVFMIFHSVFYAYQR